MGYCQLNNVCLFVHRTSDDEYLLYATMRSGYNTTLLSRDMMRDHMLLLKPADRKIFQRWQQEQQYSFKIDTNGQFVLKPGIYVYPHRIDNTWHIPCVNEFVIEHSILTAPNSWLCVKF